MASSSAQKGWWLCFIFTHVDGDEQLSTYRLLGDAGSGFIFNRSVHSSLLDIQKNVPRPQRPKAAD